MGYSRDASLELAARLQAELERDQKELAGLCELADDLSAHSPSPKAKVAFVLPKQRPLATSMRLRARSFFTNLIDVAFPADD